MTDKGHTCAATGLRLIPLDSAWGYHVGKPAYPQPSAAVRTADVHRQEWGRFDILGQTFYVAENEETAYAEVLAGFKLPNGADDPLQAIADMYGVPRETAIEWIADDWQLVEKDFRGIGALPESWRHARRMYGIEMTGPGWLVDIQHPDSISAVENAGDGVFARRLSRQGVSSLTVSTLTSENRTVTTHIADVVRNAVLEDATPPRGIHFGSKHGGAWCRALWLPEGAEPPLRGVRAVTETEISLFDESLERVADRFRITIT